MNIKSGANMVKGVKLNEIYRKFPHGYTKII